MAKQFGLNILPVKKQNQLTVPDLPGLHIAAPPRRVSRRRSQERVIFYLTLTGNAPLSEKANRQLLEKLSEIYYQSDGSTTSAMRTVSDVLNKYLLDRNMRAAPRGLRGVGMLIMLVQRDDRLLFAQCGPSHIFLISPDQVVGLHDPERSGSGLGVSKLYKIRYHQQRISSGQQMILLCPEPPGAWTHGALKNLPRMQLSAAYQRLLHRVEEDVEAALVQPTRKTHRIQLLRPSQLAEEGMTEILPEPVPEASQEDTLLDAVKKRVFPGPTAQEPPGRQSPTAGSEQRAEPTPAPPPSRHRQPSPSPLEDSQGDRAVGKQEDREPEIVQQVRDFSRPDIASPSSPPRSARVYEIWEKIRRHRIWSVLREAASAVGNAIREIGRNLRALLARALPDEQLLDLPGWVMALIAILVPLIMVAFGSYFYIKRGRDKLFESHMNTAETLLAEANRLEDPGMYYQTIAAAVEELQAARVYRPSEEVEALYQTTREELDALDRISRLEFQPLFSRGLGPDVTISEIVVTAWNDLYMLNGDTGTVIWAQSNPDGYEIKGEFSCGPIEGHVSVGPLVDIVALPASTEDQASLLGIDQNHKMIFCYDDPDETPVIFEDTSYTLGRGPVKAIAISTSAPYNLYILDPEKRAIWIEYESQNYHEGAEYFGAVDAPEMDDAVDLATNGSEMYILHQEGYTTKCITEKAIADPQCTTPFEYADTREGRDSGPFLEGASFDAFTIKSSPGQAVYMLDSDELAVYRFSTQLAFQEQFRPEQGFFNQPATAFAVTMSDRLFLAVDDQVYTAQLLP